VRGPSVGAAAYADVDADVDVGAAVVGAENDDSSVSIS